MENQIELKLETRPEFDTATTRELEEYLKREFGLTDDELEFIVVYTEEALIEYYDEFFEEEIGADLWGRLRPYVNIEAMIKDDVLSGYITPFEFKGRKMYIYW